MSIFYKVDGATHQKIAQPFFKMSDGNWIPLKRVLVKIDPSTWKEVWPSQIIYIHTGYGYSMNMFDCFGRPTDPGNYIFINNGTIGGSRYSTDFSLVTGQFPAGSTLTFINNGRVIGVGGDAMHYTSSGSPIPARGGGGGLRLDFDAFIDNTNGLIAGGGGGGGASGDFVGNWQNERPGGGGAGVPFGHTDDFGWMRSRASNGTETTGGLGMGNSVTNGKGGDLGVAGNFNCYLEDNDNSKVGNGAPGGIAIQHVNRILPGSLGLDSSKVIGRQTGGGTIRFVSYDGDGQWNSTLTINLDVIGANANVTAEWLNDEGVWCSWDGDWYSRSNPQWDTKMSPPATIVKNSNNQFVLHLTGVTSDYTNLAMHRGTLRLTLTSDSGNDVLEMPLRLTESFNGSLYA